MNEDKKQYNHNKKHNTDIHNTSDQLIQSLGVDWRGRAAACPPVARDHVTIAGLRDGRVSKLGKPDYLFS